MDDEPASEPEPDDQNDEQQTEETPLGLPPSHKIFM